MAYRRTPQIEQRLDGRRAALLTAAALLLAERGYAACSIAGLEDADVVPTLVTFVRRSLGGPGADANA